MRGKFLSIVLVMLSLLGSAYLIFVSKILYTEELPVFAMSLLVTLLILIMFPHTRVVHFLFAIFFSANLLNVFFIYLSGIVSLVLLCVALANALGLMVLLSAIPRRRAVVRARPMQKRDEISRQLGPEEETPKVTVVPIKKKATKRRKKRKTTKRKKKKK
ncbi:MAG: hypothetical protein GY861_27680 [bacterium]|nr:hypothetical protein [bacterium]